LFNKPVFEGAALDVASQEVVVIESSSPDGLDQSFPDAAISWDAERCQYLDLQGFGVWVCEISG